MKRYLLFKFDQYYPSGGWKDFKGAFDTIKEAKDIKTYSYEFFQIVDSDNGCVVESNETE